MSRKYIILEQSEVSDSLIDLAIETSRDTLRWNNDNSKTFLKFEVVPNELSSKPQLTKSQMKEELLKEAWNDFDI